jgi:hypothetical protein
MFGVLLAFLLLKFQSILAPIAFHIGVVFALMNVRNFMGNVAIAGSGHRGMGILDTQLTSVLLGMAIVCLLTKRKAQGGESP